MRVKPVARALVSLFFIAAMIVPLPVVARDALPDDFHSFSNETVWRPIEAPVTLPEQAAADDGDVGVYWIEVEAFERYRQQAAVFRPTGSGPFPIVLVLHSGGGFDGNVLAVARGLA